MTRNSALNVRRSIDIDVTWNAKQGVDDSLPWRHALARLARNALPGERVKPDADMAPHRVAVHQERVERWHIQVLDRSGCDRFIERDHAIVRLPAKRADVTGPAARSCDHGVRNRWRVQRREENRVRKQLAALACQPAIQPHVAQPACEAWRPGRAAEGDQETWQRGGRKIHQRSTQQQAAQ